MSYQVIAISPKGERIRLGFGQARLSHALDDRDDLRAAYLRKGTDWTVEVEDADGRTMEWEHAESDLMAGAA